MTPQLQVKQSFLVCFVHVLAALFSVAPATSGFSDFLDEDGLADNTGEDSQAMVESGEENGENETNAKPPKGSKRIRPDSNVDAHRKRARAKVVAAKVQYSPRRPTGSTPSSRRG